MHTDSHSPWTREEWEYRLREQVTHAEEEHRAAMEKLRQSLTLNGDSGLTAVDKRYAVLRAAAAQQRTYRRYGKTVREYINFSIYGKLPE